MFNIFRNKRCYYDYLVNETKKDKLKLYGFNEKYVGQEEQLFRIFGYCDSFNKTIKLILISDVHGSLMEDEFKSFIDKHSNYDACILLGDYTFTDIEKILSCVDKNKLYGLLGNHDYDYLSEYNITNLNGNLININGVTLLGIEGSYKYKLSDFPSFTQQESIKFLNNLPKVDILLSHDGKFDDRKSNDPAHQGLFGITYYLYKNKVSYHIHGHLHKSYKKDMLNGTKEISIYMYEYIELN